MVRGGATYRIVTDHLGSVRRVVHTGTGTIWQRLDYDEFGVVFRDSNPGFQPFGFAGGLYDPETYLVRFGWRDYDPRIGRWTAKDPIHFRGGDTNLYTYAANDPVNRVDRTGRDLWENLPKDEEVFEHPFSFRLDRSPNPHLAFGVGEHFCLGSHLARMDVRGFFRQLAERVESIELAGPVERLHASFVGGPKRVPIRYRIRPRS